jgi:hypothetical protein
MLIFLFLALCVADDILFLANISYFYKSSESPKLALPNSSLWCRNNRPKNLPKR